MSIKKPQYDDRGVLDKLSSGDIRAIDGGDLATVGDVALGAAGYVEKFVPAVGDIVPYSTPIGVALDGVKRYYQNEDERAKIAQYFDEKTIRQLIRKNPKLADKLESKFDGVGFLGKAGALFAGGTAGASALSLLAFAFPPLLPALPVFVIGGSIIGGTVANKMYNAAFEKQEQDPVVITMQIADIHSKKGYVPPEIVFAALAANVSEKSGKKLDKLLDKYTGTKLFAEALSDHNNVPMITAMMHDPATEVALRREYRLPPDPQNPMKTVAEQYAEMINNGYMKPQNLLNRDSGVQAMIAMARQQEQYVEVPNTPEARQNYVSRT